MSMKVKEILFKQLLSGEVVSGAELSKQLNVSRNAVWKAISELTKSGYNIESTPKGYKLIAGNVLSGIEIAKYMKADISAYVFDELTSTNDKASELAKNGERGIVVSNMQTSGRGRLGREFYSPSTSGLYMSLILGVDLSLNQGQLITAYTAVVVANAIEKLCGGKIDIKWVNDLFIGSKKLCGILTEASIGLEGNSFDYVIVGIGINIDNLTFPDELVSKCTSIKMALNKEVNRNELVALIADGMQNINEEIKQSNFIDEYRRRSNVIGKMVLVNGSYSAKVLGITENCAIILEHDGQIKEINGGEVSILINEN